MVENLSDDTLAWTTLTSILRAADLEAICLRRSMVPTDCISMVRNAV